MLEMSDQNEGSESNLKWLGRWGPIVGLIGGIAGFLAIIVELIAGGFALFDRLTDPKLEILGVRPVYIRGSETNTIGAENQVWPSRGIGFVLHVKSTERPISVSDVRISGKFYLTRNHWLPFSKTNSTSIEAISAELDRKKPFYRMSLAGWLTDSKAAIKLEARETAYIRVTFLEAISVTQGLSTHPDYLGFDDDSITPELTRFRVEPWEFFRRLNKPSLQLDIPDELRTNAMVMEITAGSRSVGVPTNSWLALKRVTQRDWNEKDPIHLFHDQPDLYDSSPAW